MPLDEEGAKWSCEPCIRGHRSSKCQHFDRLMMKVPKAGRPLARCPHPKGTCSCRKTYAVMVRIPKGSTCMCRPLYEVPIDQEPENASTPSSGAPVTIAPAVTPSSIVPAPSPAPGKVQKTGRRQSNLQAVPENIARALESMEQQNPEKDSLDSIASFASRDQSFPAIHESVNYQERNQASNADAAAPVQEKSCCSGKSKGTEEILPEKPEKPKNQGSCCAKKEPSEEDGSSSLMDGNPYSSTFATPPVPALQNMHTPSNGGFFQNYTANAPQAQLPMYFPPYTPPQSTPDFSYQNMSHMGLNQPGLPVFVPNQQHHGFPYATNTTCGGSSEDTCHCGDGCQCLGCASHPFNNTTKQHVQEMGLMVGLNNGGGQAQQSPYPTHPATPLDYSIPGVHQNLSPSMHTNNMQSYSGHYGDNYTPQTTLQQEADFMEASQYYTLEYPVGLPSACSDVTGSCQCGNDCSCVGCLTHSGHNGFNLDSPSAQTTDFQSKQSVEPAHHVTPKDSSIPSPSL